MDTETLGKIQAHYPDCWLCVETGIEDVYYAPSGGPMMVGKPEDRDQHIARLVANGERVAVCEATTRKP